MERRRRRTLQNKITGIKVGRDFKARDVSITIPQPAPPESEMSTPAIRFIERASSHFQGREELLISVHQVLQQKLRNGNTGGADHWLNRSVVVTGLGGMGKTEFARGFATKYKEFYTNVVWINAETLESLRSSFKKLRSVLLVSDHAEEDPFEVAMQIYRRLDALGKLTLFIFDNAIQMVTSEDNFGIQDYLPSEDFPNGNVPLILITSQNTTWPRQIQQFELNELSQEEATQFLRSQLGLTFCVFGEMESLLNQLAEELQGFPLALAMAASNIDYNPDTSSSAELKHSLQTYMELLKQHPEEFLSQKMGPYVDSKYRKTMATVWQANIRRVKSCRGGSFALHLLYIMAFLPPESVTADILSEVYQTPMPGSSQVSAGEESVTNGLRLLERFALVKVEKDVPWFPRVSVHRLVQKFIRVVEVDESSVGLLQLMRYVLCNGFGSVRLAEQALYDVPRANLQITRYKREVIYSLLALAYEVRETNPALFTKLIEHVKESREAESLCIYADNLVELLKAPREEDNDWQKKVMEEAVKLASSIGMSEDFFLGQFIWSVSLMGAKVATRGLTNFANMPQSVKQGVKTCLESLACWVNNRIPTGFKLSLQGSFFVVHALQELLMISDDHVITEATCAVLFVDLHPFLAVRAESNFWHILREIVEERPSFRDTLWEHGLWIALTEQLRRENERKTESVDDDMIDFIRQPFKTPHQKGLFAPCMWGKTPRFTTDSCNALLEELGKLTNSYIKANADEKGDMIVNSLLYHESQLKLWLAWFNVIPRALTTVDKILTKSFDIDQLKDHREKILTALKDGRHSSFLGANDLSAIHSFLTKYKFSENMRTAIVAEIGMIFISFGSSAGSLHQAVTTTKSTNLKDEKGENHSQPWWLRILVYRSSSRSRITRDTNDGGNNIHSI